MISLTHILLDNGTRLKVLEAPPTGTAHVYCYHEDAVTELTDGEIQVCSSCGCEFGLVPVSVEPPIQALCGICGQPVEHAYYVNGQLSSIDGKLYAICYENNIAYHYERGRDCYGRLKGVKNFD